MPEVVATIAVYGSGGSPVMEKYPQAIQGVYNDARTPDVEVNGVHFTYERGDSSGLFEKPSVKVERNPLPEVPTDFEANVLAMCESYVGEDLGSTIQLMDDGTVTISD